MAQVLLLVALAATVGLGALAWMVGLVCAVVVDGAFARGLARRDDERVSPAEWVTLGRASLAVGVAALVTDSFRQPISVAVLVTLSVIALGLDTIDGWLARRTRTSELGARFDGEVDAFLILALSVYVAPEVGAWVLLIGAARYLYFVGECVAPWMRAPLPARYWRKVTAAVQGITLTIAAADVLPHGVTVLMMVAALAVLAESFGRDIVWLWRRRQAAPLLEPTHPTLDGVPAGPDPAPALRGRVRSVLAVLLTAVAALIVWVALVAPNQIGQLSFDRLARVPIEALVLIVVAVFLPTPVRRLVAVVVGLLLGLLLLVKALDAGFQSGFDRRFNPVEDWSYASLGTETLRDTVGSTEAHLLVAALVVFGVLLLVIPVLATLRLTRVAAGHRTWALRIVAALGVVWGVCWVAGAQVVRGAPVASTGAAFYVVDEAQAVQDGIASRAAFARSLGQDRFRATPGNQLLTGLRGKDVLLVFVESYGKVAVQGTSFSPGVDKVLEQGNQQLQGAGFSARSAWLTSPTFGGISWLAHSTMQSGVWVDGQGRYDRLVTSGRFTLSSAFRRAGWRTVSVIPAHTRDWPEGLLLYKYNKIYDRRNLGYHGPSYAYAPMPDQYVLEAMRRDELAKTGRPPIFAELDLVSSHTPWTKIPSLVDWSALGDGSIFNSQPVAETSRTALFADQEKARAAYGKSIEYTLGALFSFVQHYDDPNLVIVMLGDHQPSAIITGPAPSHDVPVSIIAKDPKVIDQVAGWHWQDGVFPDAAAPVAPMNQFRDHFLTAFGSTPARR